MRDDKLRKFFAMLKINYLKAAVKTVALIPCSSFSRKRNTYH